MATKKTAKKTAKSVTTRKAKAPVNGIDRKAALKEARIVAAKAKKDLVSAQKLFRANPTDASATAGYREATKNSISAEKLVAKAAAAAAR